MYKRYFISIIYFFHVIGLQAQSGNIAFGTWRVHLALNEAKALAIVDQKIYCGSPGGLFYLDIDDYSLHTLSKQEGLSDIAITSLKYSNPYKTLIIGYETGNIDLIVGNKVINIPYVITSNIIGSKKINDIMIHKSLAYISCDFGVVVLNLQKQEVKESYLNIGTNGSTLSTYSTTIINDTLFLASSQGVLSANTINTNLLDFNNWQTLSLPDSLNKHLPHKITSYDNKLTIACDSLGIYQKGNKWDKVYNQKTVFNTLYYQAGSLFVGVENALVRINNTGFKTFKGNFITNIKDSEVSSDNEWWLADTKNGLLKIDTLGNATSSYPNGPESNNVFALNYVNGLIFSFQGGYDRHTTPLFTDGTISYFTNGEWQKIIPGQNNAPYVQDIVSVTFDAYRSRYIYASDAQGLIIHNADNSYEVINDLTTSCLLHNGYGVRVPFVLNDPNSNNTWVCNVDAPNGSFFLLKDNNICDSYSIPLFQAKYPLQMIIDDASNKWARLAPAQGGGIVVFNEATLTGNTPIYRFYATGIGNGNLPSNNVYAISKDRSGDIWLGTDHGVAVIYGPSTSIPGPNDANTPIFENHPLLFDQVVTCMDIDGGNRKWVGTENGIYLFSADGTKKVYYFNTVNSPLLSNKIVAVSVNQLTGEVFIGTDKGLVSYRESATTGNDNPTAISIFPNPVKTNYSGLIGITGLATDASVKITDVTGRLVYEVKANGGSASWNGRDYNGQKICAGVYVVLTSKDDGSGAIAGKIFILD